MSILKPVKDAVWALGEDGRHIEAAEQDFWRTTEAVDVTKRHCAELWGAIHDFEAAATEELEKHPEMERDSPPATKGHAA